MIVQFVGKLNAETLMEQLNDIVMNTAEKAMQENGGTATIHGAEIHDAEFTVKFQVEGMAEPQILTVEHHQGQPEMFKWIVNAETLESSSNKDESEFDEYTVAKAKGIEKEFIEIDSIYSILDLQETVDLADNYGNMSKKVYEHIEGFKVVQVRQNRKLIQEYKLIPKEDVS